MKAPIRIRGREASQKKKTQKQNEIEGRKEERKKKHSRSTDTADAFGQRAQVKARAPDTSRENGEVRLPPSLKQKSQCCVFPRGLTKEGKAQLSEELLVSFFFAPFLLSAVHKFSELRSPNVLGLIIIRTVGVIIIIVSNSGHRCMAFTMMQGLCALRI